MRIKGVDDSGYVFLLRKGASISAAQVFFLPAHSERFGWKFD